MMYDINVEISLQTINYKQGEKIMNKVERIGVTEILGKEIVFYNSWEEPLFLAKDCAGFVEVKNHRDLLTRIDDDEKVVGLTDTLGGEQESTFLTEDGLYEVLMQSRKPIAKPLKKAIKDYLKRIRKTGGAVETGREEYRDWETDRKSVV